MPWDGLGEIEIKIKIKSKSKGKAGLHIAVRSRMRGFGALGAKRKAGSGSLYGRQNPPKPHLLAN